MVAPIATVASKALPPSASTCRPVSTAALCGAAATPRRWPAVWRSISGVRRGRQFVQPAFLQQRIDRRQPAAEGRIGLRRVAQIAGGIDVVAQPLRHFRIEGVALLLEGEK